MNELILVAADDAPPDTKARADYVCDGIDDQIEIQAAIDLARQSGVRVRTAGTFRLSAPVRWPR